MYVDVLDFQFDFRYFGYIFGHSLATIPKIGEFFPHIWSPFGFSIFLRYFGYKFGHNTENWVIFPIIWSLWQLESCFHAWIIFPKHSTDDSLGIHNGTAHIKICKQSLNTSIYSYLQTSGGQSSNLYLSVVHFFNTSVN